MRSDAEVKAKLAEFESSLRTLSGSINDSETIILATGITMTNWFLDGNKRCLADIAKDPQAWMEWINEQY
jgi:hypothetical protein